MLMMRSAKFLALIGLLSMTACGTVRFERVPICPPIVEYDPVFQDRAASEFSLLPDSSAVAVLVADYLQLRDQIRACNGALR